MRHIHVAGCRVMQRVEFPLQAMLYTIMAVIEALALLTTVLLSH